MGERGGALESGDSAPDAPQRALAVGANVYLRKPVNFMDIVKTVESLLGASR